jgi:hypothetical protein
MVVAGGWFQTAGGISANRVARWDGTQWLGMGAGGMNDCVYALAPSNHALYAGGEFTTANGHTVNFIARWGGAAWGPVGTGFHPWYSSDRVLTLGSYKDRLIAGGSFVYDGLTNVAQWDGTSWTNIGGGGPNGSVYAVVEHEGCLVIAGAMSSVSGVPASGIARWDGSAWSAMGSGVNNTVEALTLHNGDLIAGGYFTEAGGVSANYIARWDGSAWHAMGSGMNGRVQALLSRRGSLYAAGSFTTAGGKSSYRFARWDGPIPARAYAASPLTSEDRVGAGPPPLLFSLAPASANPFSTQSELSFTVPRRALVRLTIHDVTGRLVATPVETVREAGAHVAVWDGRERSGSPASSGGYFARLSDGHHVETAKLVLTR